MAASLGHLSKLVRARNLAAAVVLFVGCGYVEYEARLNETKKYYAYLDKIEQYLVPKWKSTDMPMELRVPREPVQFTLIPPPPKIQHEDGTIEEPMRDTRQPDYLNLTFPELIGAWQANFTVVNPEGNREERKGYLYALSNYWQLAGDKASEAGQFVINFKAQLADTLKIPATDEHVETQPSGYPPYQPMSTYDVCTFKKMVIDGANYNFDVYSKTNGSIIGVLVFVLPEGRQMPEKLSERMPLMLASFDFTNNPPPARTNRAAPTQPAAAPAKAGF